MTKNENEKNVKAESCLKIIKKGGEKILKHFVWFSLMLDSFVLTLSVSNVFLVRGWKYTKSSCNGRKQFKIQKLKNTTSDEQKI